MRVTHPHVTASLLIAVLIAAAFAATGCVPLPRRAFASARQAAYFASTRELSPAIARAIENGHVVLGMDTEQVWVVLGDPARKTRFANTGSEVWLYRAGRLHQDHYWLGAQDVRLVFLKDRLVAVEPM